MTDTIKRNANGSIDINHYVRLGRQARSDEAYRMAGATRAATRRKWFQMCRTVEEITATPPAPAKA